MERRSLAFRTTRAYGYTGQRHLIYGLFEEGSAENRYVGRSSSGLRRARAHVDTAFEQDKNGLWISNLWSDRWIRGRQGRYDIHVLESFDDNEDVNHRLNDAEIHWIDFYRSRGHRLTNLTEGGGGVTGYRHTADSIEKMRRAKLGKKLMPEQLAPRCKVIACSDGRSFSSMLEAAAEFGVSISSISRWVDDGQSHRGVVLRSA